MYIYGTSVGYGLLCKPWQRTYPLFLHFINEYWENVQVLAVSLRFFRVASGTKGSYNSLKGAKL
jgi:hypothetical protein